jgi:hypothetical protein
MAHPKLVPKSEGTMSTLGHVARGGWNLSPFPLWLYKTPKQSIVSKPLVSRDALLVATWTTMQSPFVNDLLLQNAYYECCLKQSVKYHSHFVNVSAYEYQGK